MKKIFHRTAFVAGLFCAFAMFCTSLTAATLPDSFLVRQGDSFRFDSILPVKAVIVTDDNNTVSVVKSGGDRFILKVFGFLPAKEVTVQATNTTYVIPGGEAFGVKLYSQGVMVIGFSDLTNNSSPAYDAGIRAGDMLISLNGIAVTTNEEVSAIISSSGGTSVKAVILRDGKEKTVNIQPQKDVTGNYKSGMWVRDSTAGIGTLSYYVPDTGIFAGLGHGITDTDTGEIFPLQSGDAVEARIYSVNKGSKGTPGELCGSLGTKSIGSLFGNTECGVFGKRNEALSGQAIPVAMKQEAHRGQAYIRCTVEGDTVKEYSVEIVSIDYNSDAATKNMVIRITDEELLQKTGGIVRGMSGSPIIQDGKLIGAVTHVFVDDPTSGYAIFAENMLEAADNLLQNAA